MKSIFVFSELELVGKIREAYPEARWSRGMIRASDARGPGFKSRTSPTFTTFATLLDDYFCSKSIFGCVRTNLKMISMIFNRQ